VDEHNLRRVVPENLQIQCCKVIDLDRSELKVRGTQPGC
jgi:hypothetical protein